MSHVPQAREELDDTSASPTSQRATPLSERDRDLLDFEREWWRYAGAKEAAIRERFAVGTAEYYQSLSRLLDRDAAVEHDSLLVRRLRRQRLMRQRERSSRRLDRG